MDKQDVQAYKQAIGENLVNSITDCVRDAGTRNLQLGKLEVARDIAAILMRKPIGSQASDTELEISDYVVSMLENVSSFCDVEFEKNEDDSEATE